MSTKGSPSFLTWMSLKFWLTLVLLKHLHWNFSLYTQRTPEPRISTAKHDEFVLRNAIVQVSTDFTSWKVKKTQHISQLFWMWGWGERKGKFKFFGFLHLRRKNCTFLSPWHDTLLNLCSRDARLQWPSPSGWTDFFLSLRWILCWEGQVG